MKVKELIDLLKKYNGDYECLVYNNDILLDIENVKLLYDEKNEYCKNVINKCVINISC